MSNECNCRDDGEYEGRTYLYIRTHPEDTGAEPRPNDMSCVISPDIYIIKPDGSLGYEAVAGQRNHIEVIVTNAGGITANDAYVEVFYGGPTTGFVSTNAQRIGGEYATIEGYSTASVRIPWIPSYSDTGHICITARVGLVVPPDMYKVPSSFNIRSDRHLAQRNMHVLNLNGEKQFTFDFLLVNPVEENNGELKLNANFLNMRYKKDFANKALGSNFASYSNKQFGTIKFEINGQTINRVNGYYPVYIPREELLHAKIHVEKDHKLDEETQECSDLHVLEISIVDYNESNVGGLWIVLNPNK